MSAARRAGAWLVVLLVCACAQPQLVRDGVSVSYETAADVDLRMAQRHEKAGELREARAVLERFLGELQRSRRVDEALFTLGQVYEQLGERERAAPAWRQLAERHRASRFAPEAALLAAQIYADLGRLETGRRVLAAAPVASAGTGLRVRIYRLQADLARALGDYPDATLALAYGRRYMTDPV